jgi:hypothetical protein
MKHLRNFRIFEADDEDDEDSTIHTGFEYSFNDIKDTLWDILDLGFKITDNNYCYWSEDFSKVNLTEAKWSVWEFKLEADVECKTLVRSYSQRYGSNSQRMLLNNSNLELEVLQSLADIRGRFGNVYHRLELKSDYGDNGWLLFITIMSEIDNEEISKAKAREKESKIKSEISTKVGNFSRKIRNIGTPKFKELSSKNKLGESSWSGLGRISEGYICTFINTTKMTNQVRTRSFEEIKDSLNTLRNWYFPKNSTVELRKITKEDCKRLATIHGSTQEYMEDRYLDLDGIIVTYDYQKWYDKLKDDEE